MTTNSLIILKKIIKGLKITYQRLIKSKIEKNLELVISENGKVTLINPKTIQK